jgi:hypothetical protein
MMYLVLPETGVVWFRFMLWVSWKRAGMVFCPVKKKECEQLGNR